MLWWIFYGRTDMSTGLYHYFKRGNYRVGTGGGSCSYLLEENDWFEDKKKYKGQNPNISINLSTHFFPHEQAKVLC